MQSPAEWKTAGICLTDAAGGQPEKHPQKHSVEDPSSDHKCGYVQSKPCLVEE